ncbi:MAG: diaminopimelate decarboxylase [Gemmatimonadota bacterium]
MGEGVLTGPFPREAGRVLCGTSPATELVERFGTPLYVYDIQAVAERVRAFREAFAPLDPLLAYSVKANGNLAVLRRLRELGCGADVTSLGELARALRAGISPDAVVFAGVGKREDEITAGLEAGIRGFNVESEGELRRIAGVAERLGVVAPVAVRVNPDVLADTPHAYTATGHAAAKFGVPLDRVPDLYRFARDHPHLRSVGVDVHIGSQIVDPGPYVRALERVLELVRGLREKGVELEYLDLGGGYGIGYEGGSGMDVDLLAGEITPLVEGSGLLLILEPGRSIVGEAGVLLTRVEYVKKSGDKTFVIVDGGMSELIRPSHYGGYHAIERADAREARPVLRLDVVGPICETGDFLALDREMELPEPGEVLVVRAAGAYGFTMASNYNGRLRPAEVLVDGDDVRLIRRRETLEDLIRPEEELDEAP